MKKIIFSLSLIVLLCAGCSQADVASNSSEVNHRIVCYNGVTGEYMFINKGLPCSFSNRKP